MCQMKSTRAFVRVCGGRACKESPYAAARTATVPRREKTVVWSIICICTGAGGLVGILLERLCPMSYLCNIIISRTMVRGCVASVD